MVRLGREVRSSTLYIMGMYHCLFKNVYICDPRHNLDHYFILGYLHSATLREHVNYLGQLKCLPLQPLTTPTREDGILLALRRVIPKPKMRKAKNKSWILANTWGIVNTRVSACQYPVLNQCLIQHLNLHIAVILELEHRWQVETDKDEIKDLLDLDPPPLHK